MLAPDTTLWSDDVWNVDSTPVECGRSKETVKRSDLAGSGWAEYGYRASHSRFVRGQNYCGRRFEQQLAERGVRLLRPARKGEAPRIGAHLLKPLRQLIESVNDALKGQPDLEQHGSRTPAGVTVRVLQRILALTAAIRHNDKTGQPIHRSLIAHHH